MKSSYGYSEAQWDKFSKTEQKIIVYVREYKIGDKEALRKLLNFPLEPMDKTTFRRHWSNMQRKIKEMRQK